MRAPITVPLGMTWPSIVPVGRVVSYGMGALSIYSVCYWEVHRNFWGYIQQRGEFAEGKFSRGMSHSGGEGISRHDLRNG